MRSGTLASERGVAGGNNASAAVERYPTKLQFGGCNSVPEKWPPHTAQRGIG